MISAENRIESLRGKYQRALREMEEEHANLIQLTMRNDKLHITGAVHTKESLERIKSRLSDVDPEWSREVELNLRAPGALEPHTGQSVVNHGEDFAQAADDTGESD